MYLISNDWDDYLITLSYSYEHINYKTIYKNILKNLSRCVYM